MNFLEEFQIVIKKKKNKNIFPKKSIQKEYRIIIVDCYRVLCSYNLKTHLSLNIIISFMKELAFPNNFCSFSLIFLYNRICPLFPQYIFL